MKHLISMQQNVVFSSCFTSSKFFIGFKVKIKFSTSNVKVHFGYLLPYEVFTFSQKY